MRSQWKALLREDNGQDLVEYSLLLAFLCIFLMTILGTLKTNLGNFWSGLNNKVGVIGNSAT